MEKIKDIMYNKSDLLLTLLIVGIAALIIWWRVDAIMSYATPEARAEGATNQAAITEPAISSSSAIDEDMSGSGIYGPDVSLYIGDGESTEGIGQSLVNAGLVNSIDEFMIAVNAANAETRLRTGTFIIPQGLTPEEIVTILTN